MIFSVGVALSCSPRNAMRSIIFCGRPPTVRVCTGGEEFAFAAFVLELLAVLLPAGAPQDTRKSKDEIPRKISLFIITLYQDRILKSILFMLSAMPRRSLRSKEILTQRPRRRTQSLRRNTQKHPQSFRRCEPQSQPTGSRDR